jgi:hypothetical protein
MKKKYSTYQVAEGTFIRASSQEEADAYYMENYELKPAIDEKESITDIRDELLRKVRALIYTQDMESIDIRLEYNKDKLSGFTIKQALHNNNKTGE